MDPQGLVYRVVDTIVGQRYFRAWLGDSLDSMRSGVRARLSKQP
jgi:hypothetical protein